ncbi:hypothetical protein [Risungbinella massiliensis]|uniref:hypothetical protein n=1 Tax=Risungbinella massiliensis TaxID=1329796 RepID=UPI0005CC574F|nr:hypothetical protein [Risungbinella massiliensis]
MDKQFHSIRTELKGVYGESYPRFVKSEALFFAIYPLMVLFFIPFHQPKIIRFLDSWGSVGIFFFLLFLSYFFTLRYIQKRYEIILDKEMKQKYKSTIYYRWIKQGMKLVFGAMMILGIFSLHLQNEPKPIAKAITEYGYPVSLPTQLPFQPTQQHGIVKASIFSYDMEIFYEKDNTYLMIYISKKNEKELLVSNVTLQNGIKADYEVYHFADTEHSYHLTWYQDGFRYELIYSIPEGETVPHNDIFFNIANSFKTVYP